jgi:hypothetical protein
VDKGRAVVNRLPGRWDGRGAWLAFGLLLLSVLPVSAQFGAQQQPGMIRQRGQQVQAADGFDQTGSVQEEKQLRLLNAERQRTMVADTDKLLRLAKELDSEVGAADTETLTPAQLRKLAEIEKLAHNVREKMSTSVRGTPVFGPPIIFPMH